MRKWCVVPWGKLFVVKKNGSNIGSFLSEADAARCVEAVNSVERLREVLEKLARLGNGSEYGNSEGNLIARAALAKKES